MTLSPTSPASKSDPGKSEIGKPDPAKSERGRAELAAIVTGGAGGGIGQGIVRTLAARGWSLVVLDVDASRLGELAEELQQSGAAVEAMLTDITAPGAAEAAVETALAQFGRLDGLVNSAGIGLCKPLGTISDAEFDRLIDVDLRAAFRFSRAALPALLASQGSIVSIGSVHGARSMAGYGVYAAAKAGIEAMMRGVAIDYGARGVRANTVHPGLVMSPQTESMVRAFAPDPEAWFANYTGSKQLLPEVVTPEQIGETVEFLLSRRAAGITGQAITVDAGTTAMLNNREQL